jgi:hypothetical protein
LLRTALISRSLAKRFLLGSKSLSPFTTPTSYDLPAALGFLSGTEAVLLSFATNMRLISSFHVDKSFLA